MANDALRAILVDVEDIYDEFNFGILNPRAIKDFLHYTYLYWQTPAPAFVILFGDASWDYKKILGGDKTNFVPSYGNPVSDNWFVCFDDIIMFLFSHTGCCDFFVVSIMCV